jgi:flagellar L-ring protein precursor FlgH
MSTQCSPIRNSRINAGATFFAPRLLRSIFFFGFVVLMMGSSARGESLWNRSRYHENLFTDKKAHEVGDVVTIVIVENAQASDSTESAMGKEHEVDMGINSFFNAGAKLFGTENGSVRWPRGTLDASSQFESSGDLARKSKFTAQISALVRAVQPNGNLVIEGRRTIYLDKEKKNIVITGVVRPEDVSAENKVESTAIADAQIIYEGFGPITDSTKPGLLSAILRWLPIF